MEAVTELDRSMEDAEKYSAKMETKYSGSLRQSPPKAQNPK